MIATPAPAELADDQIGGRTTLQGVVQQWGVSLSTPYR